MPVLIPTTTVSILECTPAEDSYDRGNEEWHVVQSSIPAYLLDSRAANHADSGNRVNVSTRLVVDYMEISQSARIRDERTGYLYEIDTVVARPTALIPQTVCTLSRVERTR